MIKIFQNHFGGSDAPLEEQGNCFQACVATVLQIPLEKAFDCRPMPGEKWFAKFNEWLEQYNLGCIFLEANNETIPCTMLKGLHIAEHMSKTLYNGERHVVVICDGVFLHDPNPYANHRGKFQGVYLFVPLKAYRMILGRITDERPGTPVCNDSPGDISR